MISALLLAAALAEAPLPPPPSEVAVPLVPAEFFDGVLAWDMRGNHAVKGRQKTVLTRTEFFEQLGRPDLVEKSTALRTRRFAFAIAAAVVAVTASVAGASALSLLPDVNRVPCTDSTENTRQCQEAHRVQLTVGIGVVAGGLTAAMLMATFAWWSNPDVVDGDEATHLVAQYNASLLRRLRASPGSLRWLPVVSTDGAMVAVAGQF